MPFRRMRFKDASVLARCDERGELLAQDGRVEIRYRPGDARMYHAAARNLVPDRDGEILPDDICPPGEAVAQRGQAGGAGAKGKAGSAAAAPTSAATIPAGAVVVYADGACSGNPGPAGVGVVLIDKRGRRELSHYLGEGTNNIAELVAIELALLAIDDPAQPVRLHTDSQYSIGVLSKGWKAKANVELVARVRKVIAGFSDLQLIYVRGHSGVLLNERADALAVQAVESRRTQDWVVYPTTERPRA